MKIVLESAPCIDDLNYEVEFKASKVNEKISQIGQYIFTTMERITVTEEASKGPLEERDLSIEAREMPTVGTHGLYSP